MKAYYISTNREDLDRVYADEQRAALQKIVTIDPIPAHSLEDERLSDAEALFSTWGMVTA